MFHFQPPLHFLWIFLFLNHFHYTKKSNRPSTLPADCMIKISLLVTHHVLLPEVAFDPMVLPGEVFGSIGIVCPVRKIKNKKCQWKK